MIRIHERSGKCSARKCSIVAAHTSTGGSNGTTGDSCSDTTRCWALASFGQRSDSLERLRKFGSTFDLAGNRTNLSHSPTADGSFCSERSHWNRCSSLHNRPTEHHVTRPIGRAHHVASPDSLGSIIYNLPFC